MFKPMKINNREKVNPKQLLTKYQQKMESTLKQKGVVFFDVDSGLLNINSEYLIMPESITEVPSQDLGEYLNSFTQHKVYMRTMLGRVELLAEEARREYYSVSDPIYRKYSNSKMSETAKDRLINNDPTVRENYDLYMDSKRQQAIVQYSLDNVEDIIFLISREISRRGADFNDENRSYNVSRH